ncbi:MAG: hypothetical protein K2X08_00460 [Chlamydiales bacterium]|nr:hypothetical protein [Chlamydiales bacterium]
MTAIVNPVRPLNPPYYHREYSNDIDRPHEESSNIYKRATLVALPFLSLYKPLSLPISLGMGATRVYTSANQLISDIQSGDCNKISFDVLQTTIAVIALASTIFAHPIGMIVTTSQDIIFELSDLLQSLQKGDREASLMSLTKIINNTFYLALICRGGLELSIVSFAMQAITLVISSRDEFKKDRILEGCGNLLMAAVRVNQGYSQFKLLQRQWEIDEAIKRIVVGELHEKWQFPSDHLPVGIEVDGVKIISWNVLNNAYMEWVTTKDSQGLNGSMISDLDKVVKPNGLTQRDLIVVDMVASMMNSGQVVALQECGVPFLEALQERLPSHWQMVKSFESPRTDQDVILFDKSRLVYRPDQSGVTKDSYPSVPNRPIQNALFSRIGEEHGRDFRVVNAHIPGDPTLPVREEFAKYIHDIHRDGQVTVALGDNNFERDEMILAYERMGFSEFSLHSPWKTNIDPYGKHSKAIDHLFVAGGDFSRDLTADEVLQNGNLRETIALLNGAV